MLYRNLSPSHFWLPVIALLMLAGTSHAQEGGPQADSNDLPRAELPPVLLKMARDPAFHRELGLDAGQRQAVLQATDQVDAAWWPSRILDTQQRMQVERRLTDQLRTQLIQTLEEPQRERLRQLEHQALGTRMLLTGEVADALRLSPTVQQRIEQAALDTDQESAKIQKELQSGGDAEVLGQRLERLKKQERETILGILTQDQQRQIPGLFGQPFDFSRVTRTNPRAPELIASDDQWLQGQPVKMEALRGKVVVLHFYAFQCINCRRNLPHYNGWFDDFSSEDVVILGIQTPETAPERDPERVASALDQEGIEYRVLFDRDSENWKAWGNTMWPTVYLIDREGFIRTWWQGELNWQGGEGEQKFRELIRQLADQPPLP